MLSDGAYWGCVFFGFKWGGGVFFDYLVLSGFEVEKEYQSLCLGTSMRDHLLP